MSLVDKIKGAAKATAPVFTRPNIEDQLKKARQYDSIRELFDKVETREERDRLESRLRYHLESVNDENYNLQRFARWVDTYDRLLVPVDVVADYMKIMGGVGYGLSAIKEVAEAPVKLAYSSYYLGKTKDLKGFLGNLLYEGLSFFIPGSVLDLTNRYVKQADKYVVKSSVDRLVKELEAEKQGKTLKVKFGAPVSGARPLRAAA